MTSKQVEDFCRFCSVHSKQYPSKEEALNRLTVFVRNAAIVDKLNLIYTGVEFSAVHSPFGDISPKEFSDDVINAKSIADINREYLQYLHLLNTSESPLISRRKLGLNRGKQVDWTAKGVVSSVKNQGSLGTCWAFSAIGAVESQVAIHTGKLVDLSVEQLVECDSSRDGVARDADCAEFGGWPFLAFEFMKRFGGVYKDEKFPYCSGTIDPKSRMPQCFPCMPRSYDRQFCGDHSDLYCNVSTTKGQRSGGFCKGIAARDVAARVSGHRSLAKDEEVIAQELEQNGPVSVALNALPLQFYRRGIIDPFFCSPKDLNHAVLLVGFGQDPVSGKKFWKVKNSWGEYSMNALVVLPLLTLHQVPSSEKRDTLESVGA